MLTPRGFGARRGSRVLIRLLGVVLSLAFLAGTAFASWWFLLRTETAAPATTCPPAAAAARPNVKPWAKSRVAVNVYNSTDRRGLAADAAAELRRRGFVVRRVDNDPLDRRVAGTAEVRHGPKGVGGALTAAAQVAATVRVLDRRTDASVDLVLGAAYRSLRSPEEAAAALAARPGTAPPPSGC